MIENTNYLTQNCIMMKKIIILMLIFLNFSSVSAKDTDNISDFSSLGRYVETFEINERTEEESAETDKTSDEDKNFLEEMISDVQKRYEKNAVVLNLNDDSEKTLSLINNSRIFNLKINETQYKIENAIRNENMIWDSSKAFSQAFFADSRKLAPIPSIINAQAIKTRVSPALSASLGQTYLYDANGPAVLFVRANESTYNTGSVISYRGDSLNLSVGAFSSSYNHAASGGAILSSNSINLPKNFGSVILGGAYFANEAQDYDKISGGGFVEFTFKRLKLNAQIAQSNNTNSSQTFTSLYLIPELQITDSISLKTRFIRNVSEDTMQDELAITYKPKKGKNNFEFEINASNYHNENSNMKQRIKFTTSFKI